MAERARGALPAPWRALDEPLLQQVRLVDVLDGVGGLPDGVGERAKPDGPPLERLAQDAQDLPVELVKAAGIDLEQGVSESSATRESMRWWPRTSTTSRTRRRSRFAMRGVPRVSAPARVAAPSSSIATPSRLADRMMISASSVGW